MLRPGHYDVLIFQDRSGNRPYLEWLATLDRKTRQRILGRTDRLSQGQFGDVKSLGAKMYELRLFFGPGYRVYFGEHAGRLILILHGGDKSSQSRDIKRAREFWNIYLEDHI
jgi:putative addiction module killer protein